MRLTRLPVRRRALWIQDERAEEDDIAIIELLARLQSRYDTEDALTAARVLYDIEDSESESEEDKGAPRQSYIHDRPAPTAPVTPSKPPRPPPELLRGLLEISLPSLSSDTSHEDTSADSRLAAWLERIAQEQAITGRPGDVVPQLSKEAISKEPHHAQSALLSLSALDAHKGRVDASSTLPALKFYPITPLSGRPRPAAQVLFKRGRAFSAPATPFSDVSIYSQPSPLVRPKQVRFNVPAGSDSSLNVTLARTRNNSFVETSTNLSNTSGYDHSSDISADISLPFIPPLNFGPAEPSFIEVPWMQEFSTRADEKEETSWSPKTPLHTTNDDSLVRDTEDPPVTFHSVPLSSTGFIAAFESAQEDDSFDRHVGALRDLSGIYATNLALQHVSKSPMLIRNWQRVLDELTGRSRTRKEASSSRLRFGPEKNELEIEFANNRAARRPGSEEHLTALGLDWTSDVFKSTSPPAVEVEVEAVVMPFSHSTLSSPEVTLDTSSRKSTPVHSPIANRSFPHHKTQADRGLDHEFIHHLRLSIVRKRTEVELLKKLETQRLKTIHRLERVLSRKTLELLTSDPS